MRWLDGIMDSKDMSLSEDGDEQDISFCVLVLQGLVGLHKTIQLQLLQRYWLGHRLG